MVRMKINKELQGKKADDFLALHHAPAVLILPNAWDVASQKIFELEGCKAIGTTSAGIAATLGYADGQEMDLDTNLEMVRRIVSNSKLPVTADMEAGYATSIEGVAAAARAVLDVGAVGLNLEDCTGDASAPLFDMALQQEKIRAMREMSDAEEIHLVINARTDACLLGDGGSSDLASAIRRGNAYREAGADCIFVPDVGTLDRHAIAQPRQTKERVHRTIHGASNRLANRNPQPHIVVRKGEVSWQYTDHGNRRSRQ